VMRLVSTLPTRLPTAAGLLAAAPINLAWLPRGSQRSKGRGRWERPNAPGLALRKERKTWERTVLHPDAPRLLYWPPLIWDIWSQVLIHGASFFVPLVLAIGWWSADADRPPRVRRRRPITWLRTTQRHEVEPAFKLTMVVKNRPPHPYIRWIRWIRTMMQLCASKARLRSSSSPFFFPVQRPWGDGGLPLPRIVFWPFRRYARRGTKTW